jgi:hypothetical protein
MSDFGVKDSGERAKFDSGMVRDTTAGKVRYDLNFDGPMFERLAAHLTKGAVKYEPRNWMKASGAEERDRFKESAIRHFIQWLRGDLDEDHAAAVFFNINGYEYVKERIVQGQFSTGGRLFQFITSPTQEPLVNPAFPQMYPDVSGGGKPCV